MPYTSNDPYWLTARYAGACKGCGAPIAKGSRAFYWPKGKRIECVDCGTTSDRRFHAEIQDEAMYSGGCY